MPIDSSRLLARHKPGCWIAGIARAIPAPAPGEPEHWILAGWGPHPQRPELYSRYPEFAAIASPDSRRAVDELFRLLPARTQVLMVDTTVVDLSLAAELIAIVDRNLTPAQRLGLERFAAAERERLRAQLLALYSDRDDGFERFRDGLLGVRRTIDRGNK